MSLKDDFAPFRAPAFVLLQLGMIIAIRLRDANLALKNGTSAVCLPRPLPTAKCLECDSWRIVAMGRRPSDRETVKLACEKVASQDLQTGVDGCCAAIWFRSRRCRAESVFGHTYPL